MGRGRAKGKTLSVTNQEDVVSGEEEKIPAQKRRGRPQKSYFFLENGSSGVFVMVVSSKSPKVLWRVVGLKGTIQVERGDRWEAWLHNGGNKSWFYPFSGVTEELKTFLADTSLATLKKDQSYLVEHRLSFLEGALDVAVLDAMFESWKKQGATVQVRKF